MMVNGTGAGAGVGTSAGAGASPGAGVGAGAAAGAGAFATGAYPNLLERYGYAPEEIEARLTDTWRRLFGDEERTRIYYPSGENMGYMLDTGNLDVRTEGMSYGMMMAVQMGDKDLFDRLWRWTWTYMHMKEGLHAGYFAWSCATDGGRNSSGPAPDGEEYFALALFFASHRWGEGEPPLDYAAKARDILRACLHNGERGPGHAMWNLDNRLIKFVPECEYSDPSYHLPHFYELFALWADEADRPFWREAAAASRAYLPLACHPETGLSPEYAHYDGTPNDERGYGHFYSDAYRVAANVGLEAAWFGATPWMASEAEAILRFFADKDPADYRRYRIDGTPFDEPALHPVGLLATNACASLAAPDVPHARDAVELFWRTPVREGERRYYDNCLYMFSLLALSGRYRIWMPSA